VVFARATIPKETSSASGFATRVRLDEPLHGRVYFPSSVGQRAAQDGRKCFHASYDVAGRFPDSDWLHIVSYMVAQNEAIDAWTSVRVDSGDKQSMLPTEPLEFPADRGDSLYNFAVNIGPRLKVGDNPLEIRVTQGCMNPPGLKVEGVGQITIEVESEEALDQWRRRVGPSLERANNPEAEALVAAVRQSWSAKDDGAFVEASVLSPAWRIEQHPATGMPLARDVVVAVVARKQEDCSARIGFVRSAFDGTGYGAPALYWTVTQSSPAPFPCPLDEAEQ
jgi:hypothetical protein